VKRPLIGIPCRAGLRSGAERPIYYNNKAYAHAIESVGGLPILVPILNDPCEIEALLSRLDGLLLSGGIDVDPSQYNADARTYLGQTSLPLDQMEILLARWAYRHDMPTLGICRGMQVMNVSLGGDLYQDLATEYPKSLRHANWDQPRGKLVHSVHITHGSVLEQILGVSEVSVNSLHHQAVRSVGDGVYISGTAEDGVAEMLEVPTQRFFLAVQFHP
jgi:putative glutamine amidotransferase